MAKRPWLRDEYQFYNLFALDRAPLETSSVLGGLNGALMSGDEATGSRTQLVELPPGWSAEADGKGASLELFLLNGDVALEGERVGATGYVHVPQDGGGGELRSEKGALALAFWNPDMPAFPAPYTRNRVTSLYKEPWTPSLPGSHSIMHKSLRQPDPLPHPNAEGFDGGPGGYMRILYLPPGLIYDQEQVHHECFEEIILLQGDQMMVDEGIMGVGSVVSHPREWWHAPYASQGGALLLVNTDAPMGHPWPERPYPGTYEIAETYLDEAPLDVPAEHIPWCDCLSLRAAQDSPEYHAWRETPAGVLWHEEK